MRQIIRSKRWIRRLAALALLLFATANVMAYKHASSMMHFVPGASRPKQPEQLTISEKLGLVFTGVHLPRPINEQTPGDVGLKFETVTFPSSKGVELEAWSIPKVNARRTVLIFHGYASSKSKMLEEAKSFHVLDSACLMVDFRGGGGSTGDTCTIGYNEADDVAAAFAFAKSHWPANPIVLYGESMGAASILRAIALHAIEPDSAILACPFDSLLATTANRFHAFGLPAFPLANLMVFWGGIHADIDGFALRPVDDAKKVHCPVLMLRGGDDPRVTAEQFNAIANNLACPKTIRTYPGVGHESIRKKSPGEWGCRRKAVFVATNRVEPLSRIKQELPATPRLPISKVDGTTTATWNKPLKPIDVVLLQLGTPSEPTARGLRPYLREFLSDPRVIELPALVRWLLVNLVIVPFRSPKSATKYRRIWSEETGSPLLDITRRQTAALSSALGEGFRVQFAMRYGEPSIPKVVASMVTNRCQRVVVVPMFPQYSATTTGSAMDAFFAALRSHRNLPAVRAIRDYRLHDGYLAAVESSVRRHLAEATANATPAEMCIVSFHGIPIDYIKRGDPYMREAAETGKAIAKRMGWKKGEWKLCFQSRLGRQKWLMPYTDKTLEELGRRGLKTVLVVQPGFTADCLETIDEIGREGTEEFRSTGGENLIRVPCLNDDPSFIAALADLVRNEATGWQ